MGVVVLLALAFAMSFVGSMPLTGPIALLVFGRGLAGRPASGLAIAAGAALAEGAYAALAWLGTAALLARHPALAPGADALAAAVLLGLGVTFLLRRGGGPAAPGGPEERATASFLLGLTVTVLNPTFLATWTAAVAVVHATGLVPVAPAGALPFGAGVAAGAVAWFWVMLRLLRRVGGRLDARAVDVALRLLGATIAAMGVWFGAAAVRYFLLR